MLKFYRIDENGLKQVIPKPRWWTDEARACYKRHGVCKGCYHQQLSGTCYMRENVLMLLDLYGKPPPEEITEKECKRCGLLLPIENFLQYIRQNGFYYHSNCRACESIIRREDKRRKQRGRING